MDCSRTGRKERSYFEDLGREWAGMGKTVATSEPGHQMDLVRLRENKSDVPS
jgi:hypothetical protein